LPRLPLHDEWTEEDRVRIEESWQSDVRRRPLLEEVECQGDLHALYKTTLRMMHCFPEDIVGCQFNIRYDRNQSRTSPFWSSQFCRSLTALVVHPMWDGAVALLAVAIQYAVAVDTKDSSP
jgi:hypothetical protein